MTYTVQEFIEKMQRDNPPEKKFVVENRFGQQEIRLADKTAIDRLHEKALDFAAQYYSGNYERGVEHAMRADPLLAIEYIYSNGEV